MKLFKPKFHRACFAASYVLRDHDPRFLDSCILGHECNDFNPAATSFLVSAIACNLERTGVQRNMPVFN